MPKRRRGAEEKGSVAEAEKQDALADRADTSIKNLKKSVVDFVIYIMEDLCFVHDPATEQVEAVSPKDPLKNYTIFLLQCNEIIVDELENFWTETGYYDEPALLVHKKMWDVMVRNKDGSRKENTFLVWCKKIVAHAHSDKFDFLAPRASTEHAESALEQNAYKSMALDLLTNELWPKQRKEPKFQIRKDRNTGQVILSQEQRSWINTMLRKNLGDNKAAYFILNHGLPELLDVPLRQKPLSIPKLQSMVQELMTWHASMLQSIVDRQKHPGMATAHMCSAKNEWCKIWRTNRREEKSKAWVDLRQGQNLAKERDSGKRKFDAMSATEQQLVEDHDCDRLKKRYKETKIEKMPLFRGKKLPLLIS